MKLNTRTRVYLDSGTTNAKDEEITTCEAESSKCTQDREIETKRKDSEYICQLDGNDERW